MKYNQLFSCFDENEDLNPTLIIPGRLDSLQEFHRNFKNLKGITLKIYHGNYLSLQCKKYTAPDVCILEGADFQIITALSKALNFTPDIQRYRFKNYTNIWQEMLHDVNSGEADLVAGSVLVVSNRNAYFTSYTWSSPIYGTLFVDPIKELGFWIVIDTFDTSSYIVTILVFFIILSVMIFTSYRSRNCSEFYQNFLVSITLVRRYTSFICLSVKRRNISPTWCSKRKVATLWKLLCSPERQKN
ncbi:uncharacterized protein LOC123316784 [Coccinella septempunctata]|uniref:uncharacterized protein LOC123316784 n=1 Tax=Coccinella septempunctata TaxID=41139 RepID=UPI001D08E674|nr:uncharacterized protein LOC123316784 [Coccinella septempunctata]